MPFGLSNTKSLKKMRIGVILVHHAGDPETWNAVHSIASQKLKGLQIDLVIVDNSVKGLDKTNCRVILRRALHVKILKSPNKGYFGSANEAFPSLLKRKCNYVIVANNDVEFDPLFFANLLARRYSDDVFVVFPSVRSSCGYEQNPRLVTRPSLLKLVAYEMYYKHFWFALTVRKVKALLVRRTNRESHVGKVSTNPYQILLGVGACFLLTISYLNKVGRLPDEVFLFGEEALLSEKVIREGGRILFDGTLKVKHKEHSTVGGIEYRTYWDIQSRSARRFLRSLWFLWWNGFKH